MASFDPYPKYAPVAAAKPKGDSGKSKEIEKLANNAFYFGIIGCFIFGIILGPIAMLTGNKALKLIKSTGSGKNHESTARNGVIIGAVATFLYVIIFVGTMVLMLMYPDMFDFKAAG
ncbi:MAG: hypothetical protein JNL67_03930 [Planctomycetaceae bacterium]|nr:hypothetical protein [Planctomycetaceae bacterium]